MKAAKPRRAAGSSSASPVSEPMSLIDRSWLQMDSPNNPMVIASIMELDSVRSVTALRTVLIERLRGHIRFRQRADAAAARPAWTSNGDFDADHHLQIRKVGGRDAASRLRSLIAEEIGRELDRRFPLWQLTLFTGLPRRKVLVLFRAHHAMADGIALLRVMARLADGASGAQASSPQAAGPAASAGPLGPLIDNLGIVNKRLQKIGALVGAGLDDPATWLPQLAAAASGAAAVVRVLGLKDDNPACFRTALSGRRVVDWSRQLPLEALHRLASQAGVSLNDLFLSALAGAIGKVLREDRPVNPAQNLRISIPVNLRTDTDGETGNCFGLVLLDLPIGEQDARHRLHRVSQRMKKLKHSGEARALLICLKAVGQLPVAVETRVVNLIARKAAAVVSNLPGPSEALLFDGARLSNIVFWPPQTGSVGIGVSLISYAGGVTLGLCCDAAMLAEPRRVIDSFEAELGAYLEDGSLAERVRADGIHFPPA